MQGMKKPSPSRSFSSSKLKQLTTELLQKTNDLVACNIYISSSAATSSDDNNNTTTSIGRLGGKSFPIETSPLLHILHSSQELCRSLRSKDQDSRVAIVHAYADKAYDRSSFHLAGRANEVAQVSCYVATTALDLLQSPASYSLQQHKRYEDDDYSVGNSNHDDMIHHSHINNNNYVTGTSSLCTTPISQHPRVGLIDHISVMPLVQDVLHHCNNSNSKPRENSFNDYSNHLQKLTVMDDSTTNDNLDGSVNMNNYIPQDASGLTALYIANALEFMGVRCLPYGTAHPKGVSLATVRREWTDFFKSGSLGLHKRGGREGKGEPFHNNPKTLQLGTCTVGSPTHFVENFNIRLTSNVTKKQAMALTKRVRQRDGGVLGVEALTLPYSNGRWEVACNLLMAHEKEGTVDCILDKVREWLKDLHAIDATLSSSSSSSAAASAAENTMIEKSFKNGLVSHYDSHYVEDSYRVGTTVEQCMKALNLKDEEAFRDHDDMVRQRFQANLMGRK
jgi:glutamate formiminotransferase